MRTIRLVFLLLFAGFLAACGIEVPPAKSAYIGHWEADGMSLLIAEDGSVSYKRMKKGASTSINAPLKAFRGDDFDVGVGPMITTFKVSLPPHEESGAWKMTVDGVELTRIAQH